jgi:hypothetical protein
MSLFLPQKCALRVMTHEGSGGRGRFGGGPGQGGSVVQPFDGILVMCGVWVGGGWLVDEVVVPQCVKDGVVGGIWQWYQSRCSWRLVCRRCLIR